MNNEKCYKCVHCILWTYDDQRSDDEIYCESCDLIGQSHELPNECPLEK